MTGLEFLVLVFAAQRLTALWFEEILVPVRGRLLARAGRLGYLAGCRLCISLWASAAVYGIWQLEVLRPLIWILALSGAMLTVETVVYGFAGRQ